MQRGGVHSVRRFPKWGNFLTFAEEFLLQNEPCLFGKERTQGWKARALWQKEGRPDLDYLAREFGKRIHTKKINSVVLNHALRHEAKSYTLHSFNQVERLIRAPQLKS